MKKISLANHEFHGLETLSRDQMKTIKGGLEDPGDGEDKCKDRACTKPADCLTSCPECHNFSTSGGYCKAKKNAFEIE